MMRRPDRRIIQLLEAEIGDYICGDYDEDPEGSVHGELESQITTKKLFGLSDLERLLMDLWYHPCTNEGIELKLELDYHATLGPTKTAIGIRGFRLEAMLFDEYEGSSVSSKLAGKDLQFAHFLEAWKDWEWAPVQPRTTTPRV